MWNVLLWNPLCLISIATDLTKKILLGRRLDKTLFIIQVCWNDHLVTYFSLMYRYKISTNTLHTFKISSCRILIISCKMLIITAIFNETNIYIYIYLFIYIYIYLFIYIPKYAILCRNITIIYRQELVSLFQVQEFKVNFSNSSA